MGVYVQDTNFFSRRLIVMAVIILFHVLIVWGLASGLARQVVEIIAPPIETDIVEELQEQDEPPPPPPPELERPPVEVPPPDVTIDIPMETTSTAITDVTTARPKPAPPPPRAVKRVSPRPDPKRFPSTDEYYPASAKRLGQEGSPVVRACVGANGRLTENPTVSQSSGTPALDEGAIRVAKAGRYFPGTEDGKPVPMCFQFKVTFHLKD